MNSIENIGYTLRRLREQRGLSAKEVSKILQEQYHVDMNHRTLFNYEKGRSSPDIDRFLCLCLIYECKDILFEFGYSTQNAAIKNVESEEHKILTKYQSLTDEGKELIRGALGIESVKNAEEKIS